MNYVGESEKLRGERDQIAMYEVRLEPLTLLFVKSVIPLSYPSPHITVQFVNAMQEGCIRTRLERLNLLLLFICFVIKEKQQRDSSGS